MIDPITPLWLPRLRRPLARLRGSGVVVAVSGGGDSVGLLRLLHGIGPEFDLKLSVAHLDHGARGEESRGDARFVAELAARLGLPVDLGQWKATRPGHFEADAREARYQWLAGVARGRGAGFVAVGQTLDDQAETILHRVLRGTGIRGLSGMPASRRLAGGPTLIRPLIGVTRREVRDYLGAIGQDFRDDSSNLDTSRTRSRIRLELLPELARTYNPAVAEALVRLGRLASESTRVVEKVARARARSIVLESGPERIVIDHPRLSRLAPSERAEVLRVAWRDAGWPEGGMDARRWWRLATSGRSKFSVGVGIEADLLPDRLVLTRSPETQETPRREPIPLSVPGWVDWGDGRIVATLEGGEPRDESVDRDRLIPPLVVRQAEPGDRFDPLGLDGGTQALNDFFRGRRVSRNDRGSVPIVSDAVGIVWVAGHRIAHRVRRTEATARTLGLRFEASPGRIPA